MWKKTLLAVIAITLPITTSFAANEVNVYSARKEKLIKPLLDVFSKNTGITVNLVTGKADALLKRLEAEGSNSPADVLITTDAGRLHRAGNLLAAVQSTSLNQAVPAHLRDPDGRWYALSLRARPIFYAKDKVKTEELSSYEALAEPKWQGRICIRSSSNIYNQSLVASMIANIGIEKTEAWAKALVANFAKPPKGGDRDQIKAAAVGVCDIAIANTYYFAKMLTGNDVKQQKAASKVAIFWPNQKGRGTHVNISGIGMTTAAKNKVNAMKLMVFLVSIEAQEWYAKANYEYPVRAGVTASDTLKIWGAFTSDSLNLVELGKRNTDAVKLMDRARWK